MGTEPAVVSHRQRDGLFACVHAAVLVCGCGRLLSTNLSKAGHDISSLSSEPSLLPADRQANQPVRGGTESLCMYGTGGRTLGKTNGTTLVLAVPNEMPLDSVELSACPRAGVWLSITLSSRRCLEPALGKVALLNSTVFILWMKL